MPGCHPPSIILTGNQGAGTITLQEPTNATRDIKDHQVQLLQTECDDYRAMADAMEDGGNDIGFTLIKENVDIEIKDTEKTQGRIKGESSLPLKAIQLNQNVRNTLQVLTANDNRRVSQGSP